MSKLVQLNPNQPGPKYWRSLGELYNKPEFRAWVDQEFAGGAAEAMDHGSRRTVLKVMAASFGLAGLTACRRPEEKILPLSRGVEGQIPGKAEYYASQVTFSGVSTGVLVETYDGRPTKIEGNDKHPTSFGATNALTQASVLNLYDPDRSKTPLNKGRDSSWKALQDGVKALGLGDGTGVAVLSELVNSPSLDAMRKSVLAKYPKAKWVEWEPVAYPGPQAGAMLAFGQAVETLPQYDKAKVILSLDYDFLGIDSPSILPTKQFADGRRIGEHAESMNRLYIVEGQFSLTGATADHRLRMKVSEVKSFAMQLAEAFGVLPSGLNVLGNTDKKTKFLNALVKDLKANTGAALVVAGPRQPAVVHAIAHLINGALNAPVTYAASPAAAADPVAAIKQLTADINSGAVSTLVILGGNPAFSAPADLRFADAIGKVRTSIHLGLDVDETAKIATWHVPQAHALECWGDGRAIDGTISIQQPMIAPLYGGKSAIELVDMIFNGNANPKGGDLVKNYWMAQLPGDKENSWRTAIHDGIVAGSAAAAIKPAASAERIRAAAASEPKPTGQGMEVSFYPSATCYDGRFANNGWMQECPDPMTKIVWGNAALLSPKTMRDKNLENNDLIKLTVSGQSLTLPVMVQPGMADNAVWLNLGYGRKEVGRVGEGVGFNAYAVRTTNGYWVAEGASVEKDGGTFKVSTTQEWNSMTEPQLPIGTPKTRPIVREATIEEYKKNPKFAEEMVEHPPLESLYPEWAYDKGFQWGMAIDLNACTGCNSCIIACQAENNIPIVGKNEVMRGREMHWIRLDRYYTGSEDDPQAVTQPVNCMQCENAPCENVCPVAATVHSPEGLNDMAYNRCVGTRYCANNCPYKVRRFNFLNWHKNITEVEKMVHNPDVTVRMRGIMEKCTYCTQRISRKKIEIKADARRENKPVVLKDGELQTACQQVCPADAIEFGNILDPESRVAKLKKQERNYAMLAELNVKPRTTYLAKLRNPNPELA
ncbi:molybdopterin oxidoreductase [Bryobacterales bacterium F-183]|nr:molybdopterin oxidoreductase [Bryobacterales bacterium F-183]